MPIVRSTQPGTAATRGDRAPAAVANASAISRWLSAGPVGACHTLFHSVRILRRR